MAAPPNPDVEGRAFFLLADFLATNRIVADVVVLVVLGVGGSVKEIAVSKEQVNRTDIEMSKWSFIMLVVSRSEN